MGLARMLVGTGLFAYGIVMLSRSFEKRDGALVGLVFGGRAPGPGQAFLVRRSPTHLHRGVDISARSGAAIYAPKDGVVAAVWPDGQVSGYGNTLVIRHAGGEQTLYAHLSRFAPGMVRGKEIKRGERIGQVGVTQLPRPPMTSKPHLHFEVHAAHTLAINEHHPARLEPVQWLADNRAKVAA